MKIGICVKPVYEIDSTITTSFNENAKYCINTYDEYAVEEAVKLKKLNPDNELIAISIGTEQIDNTLKHVLSLKIDRAIHVLIDNKRYINNFGIASIIKEISDQEGFNLIIMGSQSVDTQNHQTGSILAGLLGWAEAMDVIKMNIDDKNNVTLNRITDVGNIEIIKTKLPVVTGVTKGINEPGFPSLKEMIAARKKEIKTVKLEDLPIDEAVLYGIEIEKTLPVEVKSKCKFIEGNPDTIAEELIRLLKQEDSVI